MNDSLSNSIPYPVFRSTPDLFHTEESDYIPIIVKSPAQYLRNYPADEDDGGWLAGCKGYMWIYYDE